jgi:hypothetical protein
MGEHKPYLKDIVFWDAISESLNEAGMLTREELDELEFKTYAAKPKNGVVHYNWRMRVDVFGNDTKQDHIVRADILGDDGALVTQVLWPELKEPAPSGMLRMLGTVDAKSRLHEFLDVAVFVNAKQIDVRRLPVSIQ